MKKTLKYMMFAAVSAMMISCSNFDDINTDPDNPTNMDPDLLISTMEFYPGAEWQEQNRYFIFPAGFMNQWSGSWSTVEYAGCGQKHSNYHERLWTTYYPEGIKYSTDVIVRTKDDPSKVNVCSMARIMRVLLMQRLTDYYGDVPYSEAGLGYYGHNLRPKYDTQEYIYHDFLKELREAAQALDESKPLSQYDLIYGGDVRKWRKFANSLRLRVAMRLIKVEPELAKAEAEDAIAAGIFTCTEDAAFVKYENIQNGASGKGKGNAVANYLYGNDVKVGSQIWLTTELVQEMEVTGDPRLLIYGEVMLNDDRRTDITALVRAKRSCYSAMTVPAQRYAYSQNTLYPADNTQLTITVDGKEQILALKDTRLRPSHYLTAFDSPYIYMGYAEAEFLACEAAARGWNAGSASEHYRNAVRAAMDQMSLFGAEIPVKDVNAYLSANPFDQNNAIQQVNTHLWILHILDPLETWANWRRSGYPKLIFHNYEPSKNQSNGTFPRRMEYPLEEQLKNADNYREAVERIGKDDWTERVWWDKEI